MGNNSPPVLCHLLQNDKIEYYADLWGSLAEVKEYVHESHLFRHLKQCKQCGQLFFFEFLEWIDWANGNDPQYDTWIPVKNEHEAEILNAGDSLHLNILFGLHRDWPSDMPKAPAYATLRNKPTGEKEKFLTANCSALDILDATI